MYCSGEKGEDMSTLKVKINIAGRQYPLTINAEEELAVREAGKEINQLIKDFEERYAVTDKQDAIAMVALQMSSKYNMVKRTGMGSDEKVEEKLDELTELIDNELEN